MRNIQKSIDVKIYDRIVRSMKLKYLLLPLIIAISPLANAWEKIGQDTYSIYGTKIYQSSPMLEPFAEIVYNKKQNNFGVSFINKKGQQTTIPYGIFRIRTCAMDTVGAVAGPILRDPASEDQMDLLFVDCKRPMYFRIWDTSNNFALYKFEKVGPIKEE